MSSRAERGTKIKEPVPSVARDRKSRLLLIGPLPPPFIGPAVATERLVRSRVMREAFDIELLDTSDPGDPDGIGRFSLHNVSQALMHGVRSLRMLIAHRPDAVYIPIDRAFWGFLRDLLFILPARLLGAKVVVHLRAGRFDLIHDFGAKGRLLASIGLGPASRAIVLGETVRDLFGRFVPANRISVVPNGIDLESWPVPDEERYETDRGFHIVYLANLFRDKGAHIMLEALPLIIAEVPDVTVSFAGEWLDASFREHCLDLVARNNLHDHVHFAGVVKGEDKRNLLASADVVAFVPVAPEGLPWVVLEAMASSRPVVGTPQGTMKEVIVDGETGYLIEPGNAAALAEKIILLARDPQLRRHLGAAARARVEERYSEEASHRGLARAIEKSIKCKV